jgi:hypothetical protein
MWCIKEPIWIAQTEIRTLLLGIAPIAYAGVLAISRAAAARALKAPIDAMM